MTGPTRLTLVITAVCGLLCSFLAPVQAATSTVTVMGFEYADSGLTYVAEDCASMLTPARSKATQLYRAGGTTGTHATGISFGGATGSESGVLARITGLSTTSSVRVDTYHPAGPDADAAADGHFVVKYDYYSTGFATYFVAYSGLDVAHTGWGSSPDLATIPLTWYWFDGQTVTGGYPQRTIAQMGQVYGDNGGALVGFEFGCNGRDYFMDNFRLTTAAGTTTYDFEAHPSETVLATTASHEGHHDGGFEPEQGITDVTIVARQGHWLGGASGHVSHHGQHHAGGMPWLSGQMSLLQRAWDAGAFVPQGQTEPFDDSVGAWFKVYPKEETTYALTVGDTDYYRGSTSPTLTVHVKRFLKAATSHRKVLKGRTVRVSGRIEPGDRGVKVRLESQVRGRWRGVDKTRTKGGGKYVLRTTPTEPGKAKFRVVVAAAGGNLANTSEAMRLRVLAPPKPKAKPQPPPRPDPVVVVTTVPEVETDEEVQIRVPDDDIRARPLVGRPAVLDGSLVDRSTPAMHDAPPKPR